MAAESRDDSNSGPCAFCPGREDENGHEKYAIRDGDRDDAPDWRVRVIENKYPALSVGFEKLLPSGEGTVYGACRLPGFGSHEVIIETPCHGCSLSELPVSNVAEVLKAYRARLNHFQNDSRFKFFQAYKNRGSRAGASMTHSHSQLIALPVIAHNIQTELQGAQMFYDKHKECILCGIVKHETQSERIRLIDENEHFITVSPYAPMYPYETWLMPKRHSSNYETITEDEIQAMAKLLKLTLRKIDSAFAFPPYNYTLQTAPLGEEHRNLAHYHWYLNILPHLSSPGGFELGSGSYINPVIPEEAAKFLRNVEVEQ
jgi:UDPglucose--hexose-1-phosphate uridylyltransferase